MSISPLQLSFYKGMGGKNGALQFNLQKPHFYCPNMNGPEDRPCGEKDWSSARAPACPRGCSVSGDTNERMKSREGCLFLDITSTKGKNVYDWDNKIKMALSLTDLSKLLVVLEGLNTEVSIVHDPGARTASQGKITKTLKIASPKGLKEGVLISAIEKRGTEIATRHMVPLSGDEAKSLAICIRHVLPKLLNW